MKEIRCVVCRTEFSNDEIKKNKGCPVCGYQGLTMLTNGDINIDINWFELRLMCMWAEALALQVGDTHTLNAFYSIAREIKNQIPEAGRITMFDKPPESDNETEFMLDDSLPPDGTVIN